MNPDIAQGLYWYLALNHRGLGSDEYRMLSRLSRDYKPSFRENAPDEGVPSQVYNGLSDGELDAEAVYTAMEADDEGSLKLDRFDVTVDDGNDDDEEDESDDDDEEDESDDDDDDDDEEDTEDTEE